MAPSMAPSEVDRDMDKSEDFTAMPRTTAATPSMENIEDDPHRAALELNPEHHQRLTWSATLAVFVCSMFSFVIPAAEQSMS
jgi:hypothetical protein